MYIIGMKETEKEVTKCFNDYDWKVHAKMILVSFACWLATKFLNLLLTG